MTVAWKMAPKSVATRSAWAGGGGRGETPWLHCATFARGAQATVQLGNARRCHGFHGSSRRPPPHQIKKQGFSTVPQKCQHQNTKPTRRFMPRSSKHGPSGRDGKASFGSSAEQHGLVKTLKRHGQAEVADPQQRSAGSCIPTSPGTEARHTLRQRAAFTVILGAAGAPPWRELRTGPAGAPPCAHQQKVGHALGDCPVRQARSRRSLRPLDT